MAAILQDIRFAFRGFARNRGFTAAVVISIALGIAANTTVFTMVNALLLGDLPVREPSRLVSFANGNSFSWLDFDDYRSQGKSIFEDVSARFPLVPASLGGTGEPERLWGQLADSAFFSTIGVPMQFGRGFSREEDTLGRRSPVVVLSDGLWRRRFAADPAILGREITLNNGRYTVIGVTARGFRGIDRGLAGEFWLPLSLADEIMPDLKVSKMLDQRTAQWVMLAARLQPGVSRRQAVTAVNAIKQRLDAQYRPGQKSRYTRPMTLDSAGGVPGFSGAARGAAAVLMAIVGLVLLIACVNVASLLLARATTRQKEIGIRLSVGAGRGRLVRQLLTESVLLSLIGTVVGLLLAVAATRAIAGFQVPFPVPVAFQFSIDLRVLAFTSSLGVLTGIVFGLAPALRATRPDLVGALKDETTEMGRRRFGARGALVLVQVALSLVLLVCAGLFARSLQNASSIDLGMRTDGIVMMAFDPKLHHYTPERTRQFVAELRRRVSTLPGVQAVSFVDSVPLSIGGTNYDFEPAGAGQPKKVNGDVYSVGTGYFAAMGIPVRRGRDFDAHLDTGQSIVINEEMARQAFPGQDAIGRQLTRGGGPGHERQVFEVIGVVRNAKSRTLGEAPAACAYFFLEPKPEEVISLYGITILVRSGGAPGAVEAAVRNQIHALDANLPVFNAETMQAHVDRSMLFPRLLATLLGLFGAIGIVLATVGLYGVVSYAAKARTREIGIRMALGATASSVLATILRQGLILVGTGLAIGLGISLAVTQFTGSLLYGVGTRDPFTFIAVPLFMLAVGSLAVLIPARRAALVDPLRALRHE